MGTRIGVGAVQVEEFENGQCSRCGGAAGSFGDTFESIWLGKVEGESFCTNCLANYGFATEPIDVPGQATR